MEQNKLLESVNYIKEKINITPEIGVILGSGLGDLASEVQNKFIIKYSDIPNFPVSTVKGHAGQFVIGDFEGKKVIMMQGRFHYYEGNKMDSLTMPVYVMKQLGVKYLIVTNAAGGINTEFKPGDLMIINDHINLSGNNPLIGKNNDNLGARFPDMSKPYSVKLSELALRIGNDLELDLKEGIYLMTTGPSFETPAEIRAFRILGADAVGMSTVPEVIAANHCGIKVLGISCITNMASGILNQPLNHEEVIETSNLVKDKFTTLVKTIVKTIEEV